MTEFYTIHTGLSTYRKMTERKAIIQANLQYIYFRDVPLINAPSRGLLHSSLDKVGIYPITGINAPASALQTM